MNIQWKSSVSAAVLALFLSAPALAADLGVSAKDSGPVISDSSSAYSWTGPWAALMAGYQIPTLTPSGEDFGYSAQGAFGEIQLGYDRQFGNLVASVYLCASYSMIDHLEEGYCGGARAGLLVTRDTLAYLSGAYRWQSVDLGGDSIFASGPAAGTGIESRLTKNISLKIEAQHTWVLDVDGESVPDEIDLSDNRVMAGLVFRLGGF